MRKANLIFVILGLTLSACYAQTVVVTDFTIAAGNSVPYIKTFENQWNDELEFAVYGWIRIPSWVNSEVQVFRLSANKDINSNTLGDRVLKSFVQDNKVMFETYDAQNYDPKVQHSYLNQGDSFGQWFFIYQGYNPKTTKTYGWVQNAAGKGQGGYSNQLARHTKSNFYQVIVGPNSGLKGSDKVEVKILWIQAGSGAYRENNFDTRDTNVVVVPIPSVKCPTVYSQCDYKGDSSSYCQSVPSVKIPVIKSVVIPDGFNKITVYNLENYKGKTVIFNKSVSCLDKFEFAFLEREGYITVIDNKESKKSKNALRSNRK
nr:C-terminal crystallin fold containing protein 6p [Tetrahymena thermophila]